MREYHYTFIANGQSYHVYAPSKEDAIRTYLEEKEITELPKNVVITRTNI